MTTHQSILPINLGQSTYPYNDIILSPKLSYRFMLTVLDSENKIICKNLSNSLIRIHNFLLYSNHPENSSIELILEDDSMNTCISDLKYMTKNKFSLRIDELDGSANVLNSICLYDTNITEIRNLGFDYANQRPISDPMSITIASNISNDLDMNDDYTKLLVYVKSILSTITIDKQYKSVSSTQKLSVIISYKSTDFI